MRFYRYITLVGMGLAALAFLFIGCTGEANPSQAETHIPVQLGIQLENKLGTVVGPTGSGRNVNAVEIEISGEGLESSIQKKLDIIDAGDRTEARGTFELPLGNKDIYILASLIAGNLRFELFEGFKSISVESGMKPVLVPLQENTDDEELDYYHSTSFDAQVTGYAGTIYAALFDYSGLPGVLLKTIGIYASWQGNPGAIQIFVDDDFDPATPRFISEPLSPPANADEFQWRFWDLIWDPPVSGVFNGALIVGILYYSGEYPAIGYDTSNPSGLSVFYDPIDASWYTAQDGDFAISIILHFPVQQPSTKRRSLSNNPTIKMKPFTGKPLRLSPVSPMP